jgi:hypothetical protein
VTQCHLIQKEALSHLYASCSRSSTCFDAEIGKKTKTDRKNLEQAQDDHSRREEEFYAAQEAKPRKSKRPKLTTAAA